MQNIEKIGVMIDCSRGGVPTTGMLKKFIDCLSEMGYNYLQLYTEDVFTIDDEPYFGYMRGRYTQKEISEVDRYAKDKGIELIPCIQTLAHLTHIFRWPRFSQINDCDDILLIDDPKTYEFIDRIFSALAKCYSSRTVHIGMDEAGRVGLGQYLKKHGYKDRVSLFCKHLSKVVEIAKKYGFKPMMWSDMFFNLLGDGYSTDIEINEDLKEKIPPEVTLVMWEYFKTDKEYYDRKFKNHKLFDNPLAFAAGGITWTGFCPANKHSINAMEVSVKSCLDNGINNAFVTLWGDNGNECSYFSALPSLMSFAEFSRNNFDEDDIKNKFEKLFGIKFDDYMTLDAPNKIGDDEPTFNNPNKYLFYNDPFIGLFDQYVDGKADTLYKSYSDRLNELSGNTDFGYLFSNMKAFCDVMTIKANLGNRIREAYTNKDLNALKFICENDLSLLEVYLERFYETFRTRWNKENKSFGFEVHDMRFGGLIQRIKNCKRILTEYINGEIEDIRELEETKLDYWGGVDKFDRHPTMYQWWYSILTVNNV